jgi:hypothetical protein
MSWTNTALLSGREREYNGRGELVQIPHSTHVRDYQNKLLVYMNSKCNKNKYNKKYKKDVCFLISKSVFFVSVIDFLLVIEHIFLLPYMLY